MNTVDTKELFSQYPHIAKKITSSWGYPECRELLVSLISDSRGGIRSGFSHENAKTLFALLSRHDALYPQFDKLADVWSIASPDADSAPAHRPMTSQPAAVRTAGRHAENRHGDWMLLKYVVPFFALIVFVLMFKALRLFF